MGKIFEYFGFIFYFFSLLSSSGSIPTISLINADAVLDGDHSSLCSLSMRSINAPLLQFFM